MPLSLRVLCFVVSASWCSGSFAQTASATPAPATPAPATLAPEAASTPPAYTKDPQFLSALAEARVQEQRKAPVYALDAYKKADKIAQGHCMECLAGIYNAEMSLEKYKDAIQTSINIEAASETAVMKSRAAAGRGRAIMAQGGSKPKPEVLEAAHAAFQEAEKLDPKNATAWYNDGQVLARMGQMEEAKTDFKHCLECAGPHDPSRLRVQHFAENPELSMHKMAPAFEVTALDGQRFNLDAMGGRVVLIDFWATWCGPCNEELPHMKKIAKEFAGQPLVIISVSWDHDDEAWKKFIVEHEMTWVQYRDADHKLSDKFGINAIPHYFTIDSDGVLTAEMLGEGSDVEGKLKKLIAKANEAKRAAAAHAGEGQ